MGSDNTQNESNEEEFLKEIRSWLRDKKMPDGAVIHPETDRILTQCLDLIEQLRDENESVWFMLEEEHNSRLTPEHAELLQKSIEEHMAGLKMMQSRKADA